MILLLINSKRVHEVIGTCYSASPAFAEDSIRQSVFTQYGFVYICMGKCEKLKKKTYPISLDFEKKNQLLIETILNVHLFLSETSRIRLHCAKIFSILNKFLIVFFLTTVNRSCFI